MVELKKMSLLGPSHGAFRFASAPHGIRCLGLPAFGKSVVFPHMAVRSLRSTPQPHGIRKKKPGYFRTGQVAITYIIIFIIIPRLCSLFKKSTIGSSSMPMMVSCLLEPTELLMFAAKFAVLCIQQILLQYQRP